jgi:hypothetical protein
MYIFIKTFENKTFSLQVDNTQKISIIFGKLLGYGYNVTELNKHKLLYSGKDLDFNKTFNDYNITELATIYWYIRKPQSNCDMCGNH